MTAANHPRPPARPPARHALTRARPHARTHARPRTRAHAHKHALKHAIRLSLRPFAFGFGLIRFTSVKWTGGRYTYGYFVAYCDDVAYYHLGATSYGRERSMSYANYQLRTGRAAMEYFEEKYGDEWSLVSLAVPC